MAAAKKPKLTVSERRYRALCNERDGVREFIRGLHEHLETHPDDTWATKSLEHYQERLATLVNQIDNYE